MIRAARPDREPTWPAFLEGRAVLRVTDTDANNWHFPALRNAPTHYCHRRSPSPHASDDAGDGRAPQAQTVSARGWGGDSVAGRPPRLSRAPQPTPPPLYGAAEGRAPPPVGGRAGAASARGGPLPRSPPTADR